MKKAFTMIELIFVIVIIAILSSIALPSLSATRDDAKVSTMLSSIRNIIANSRNYYVAKGESAWINSNVYDAVHTYLHTDNTCTTLITNTTKTLPNGNNGTFYLCSNTDSIVKLDFTKTHITVSATNNNSVVAKEVKESSTFKSIAKSHRLGGVAVNR